MIISRKRGVLSVPDKPVLPRKREPRVNSVTQETLDSRLRGNTMKNSTSTAGSRRALPIALSASAPPRLCANNSLDRKRVVQGKSVSVRVDVDGRRIIHNNT